MRITGERRQDCLDFANRILGVNFRLDNVKMISHVDENDQPCAVVLFSNANKSGCEMSIASDGKWVATRECLRECFYYVFVTCGFNRAHAVVEHENQKALIFNQRIGFKAEAFLQSWFELNSHGVLLVMFKHECKWLRREK